jgi:predicted nucleic acid-binding protein
MTIVLDTSGAVEIALENEKASEFLAVLQKADIIIAPDIYVSEVTNVFWKYRSFSQFTDDACLKGIEFCVNLVDDFIDSKEIWREAYLEGTKRATSTYDMFYLVVARRNAGLIISMDTKLNLIAKKEGLKVR